MSRELFESMSVYTWAQPVYVAYVDILGFQTGLEYSKQTQDLAFGLWRNCLPLRSMLSIETPKLNFVQISDALVIYGDDEQQVLNLICNVYGAALVWGVPIRGGIGHGVVNHAEDRNRPGTIVSFYGGGLNDARKSQQNGKGRGMRLLFSDSFQSNAKLDLTKSRLIDGSLREYPWWLQCGLHSSEFAERASAWWTSKVVGRWFVGGQREDTKHIFERATAELRLSERI